MSAEQGWIGEPQPPQDWHMPAWVKTGGAHFVTHQRPAETPDSDDTAAN